YPAPHVDDAARTLCAGRRGGRARPDAGGRYADPPLTSHRGHTDENVARGSLVAFGTNLRASVSAAVLASSAESGVHARHLIDMTNGHPGRVGGPRSAPAPLCEISDLQSGLSRRP